MTTETPPTWAIKEALKRAGADPYWDAADIRGNPVATPYAGAILALATMIAKYEQQPVDPVAQVLADYWGELGGPTTPGSTRNRAVTALRTALEKNGMLK